MSKLDTLNAQCFIDCEREYKIDEMAFILAIAAITEEDEIMLKNPCEMVAKYRELLPIYEKIKEWLESGKGGD